MDRPIEEIETEINRLANENLLKNTLLTKWDVVAVIIYIMLVTATGFYSICNRKNRNTETGYFLAGRFMWWLPVGASLFASNIGSEHFIGLAGSGAAAGIGVGAFELNALILLQLLGWVFLPVFIASGVMTLPQYMTKRFSGRRIETMLAFLSILLYIFTKISVNMYAGAIFIEQALKWNNLYLSISILILLTAVLTIGGGLTAVIYTDTLQFFIMIIGSTYLMLKAFMEVGGMESLKVKYIQAIPDKLVANTSCGIPRVDSWVMLRSADPSVSDMPWPAFLLGQTPASIWYWCADQMMVQRVMAAKSLSHAQGGTIFAGFAKLLPLFMIVLPGMISRVLYPNEVGCADPLECQRFCGANSCTNFAYPKLVFELMPSGMKGVMLSVMLSALMSDLTSIFNSASTLFTMDIWTLFRPKAQGKEKLFVGRVFVLILVGFSIAWIPIIQETQGGQLYIYIQAIAAYLAPPIAAVYCLSIMWSGTNESGAFWGLITGFVVGFSRMLCDFMLPEPPCYEVDERPIFYQHFHYMYFAMILFWLTIAVSVVLSLRGKPPLEWKLIRTTYRTRFSKENRPDDSQVDIDAEDRAIFDSAENVESSLSRFGQVKLMITKFFCEEKETEKQRARRRALHEHLMQLTSLQQGKWEKRILRTVLFIVVVGATFLYVYFSINPFTPEEVQQLQKEKIQQIMLFQQSGNITTS